VQMGSSLNLAKCAMMNRKHDLFDPKKHLHLGISAMVVILAGLAYGAFPAQFLPILFDFEVKTVDLLNVFRAIMGLYIGLAMYWTYGIINPVHWRSATIVCTIFMGGLALGRFVSMAIDGIPSLAFAIGAWLELAFMVWGLINLKSHWMSADS
jgi:hypothetical protein